MLIIASKCEINYRFNVNLLFTIQQRAIFQYKLSTHSLQERKYKNSHRIISTRTPCDDSKPYILLYFLFTHQNNRLQLKKLK